MRRFRSRYVVACFNNKFSTEMLGNSVYRKDHYEGKANVNNTNNNTSNTYISYAHHASNIIYSEWIAVLQNGWSGMEGK